MEEEIARHRAELEEMRYKWYRETGDLEQELDDLYNKIAYEENIRKKYPAVAEAYKNYMILFNLAKESEDNPDVAKAA